MEAFCFATMAEKLKGVLLKQKDGELDFLQIDEIFSSFQGNDIEKKSALDQAARDAVKCCLLNAEKEVEEAPNKTTLDEGHDNFQNSKFLKDFIHLVIALSRRKYCTNNLPIMLLSEVFEALTLKEAEKMFSFVEEHVNNWTSEPFSSSGKNHLLRMCNDILRRLSKTQNTIFCGRIQLFLAQLFPLEEKSALNLNSNFDVENVTHYRKFQSSSSEKLENEVLDGGDDDITVNPVDYNLYLNFWSLQDFFREPPKCYTTSGWEKMKTGIKEVLKVFTSQKLDYNIKKRKGDADLNSMEISDIKDVKDKLENYFAKYLTNDKLLSLQINDSNFRRYFLVQVLILFQYLLGVVKFKGPSQVLSEAESKWINTTTEDVYKLLSETPLNGKQFSSTVKYILKREENWINWKNDGCPSFAKPIVKSEGSKDNKKTKKRSIGDEYLLNKNKRINMGTAELTRLWNLNPDNLEACKQEKRLKFLPNLENFFEEAIEQADPGAGIEDEYKLVNDPNFQWKALRLLARRSQHFFVPSSAPFKVLPEYLNSVIGSISEDIKKNMETKIDIKEEPEETYVTTSQVGET